MSKKIKYIDLFAGIGGFHQAFDYIKKANECVFASELDDICKKQYLNQFNIHPYGDINTCWKKIPNFDFLCAGFPCQTFSKAGKQKGFSDEKKGNLFFSIINILKKHSECKFFLLENVRNISKNIFWDTIKSELKQTNFYFTEEPLILSPTDFGIPQSRERVYILGVNKKIACKKIKQKGKISKNDLNFKIISKNHAKNAFSILDKSDLNLKYEISKDELNALQSWEKFKKNILGNKQIGVPIWLDFFGINKSDDEFYLKNKFDSMPLWKQRFVQKNRSFYLQNKKNINIWYKKHSKFLYKKIFRKFEWNCGCKYINFKKCIIQMRQSGIRIKRNNSFPSLVAIVNTPIIWDNYLKIYRRISPKEAAKLQSFKNNYKFISADNIIYKQLGNSVNVKILKILIEKLLLFEK